MTTIDRYLTKRLFSTFFKTCISLLTLFIVIDLLTHRRSQILEQDVPVLIVLEYYMLYIPVMLNTFHMAPLSLLIAGLLVFGTFVQRVEYTAMLASGIGLKRMMLAPLLVALTVGLGMFSMNETLGTYAAQRTHDIEYHYFGKIRRGDYSSRNGIFWANLKNGWKCDIRKFNRQAMTGEHVFLYAHYPNRHEQIEAKRIFWDDKTQTWILEDGTWTVYDLDNNRVGTPQRITQTTAPFSEVPDFLFTAEIDTQTQSIAQLSNLMEKHQYQGSTARRMTLDLHTKIVSPLLCLLFMSLSIPFSIRLGRGNVSIGLSVAIFLGLGYVLISSITQSMGYSGQIPPIFAAWVPFIVYFFVSSGLIFRTPS
jgi:lipopolysaccharide export system permease protein